MQLVDSRLHVVVRFLQRIGAAALLGILLALICVYFTENHGRFGIYNAIKGASYVVSQSSALPSF